MFDSSLRAAWLRLRLPPISLGVVAAALSALPALLLPGIAGSAGTGESALGLCGAPSTRIHDIQGRGRSSPLLGATSVIVEAVVVGLFPGLPEGLGGFFVQEEDSDVDRDPLTSQGLFVFAPDLDAVRELTLGDVVRVRGDVQEFFGMTELSRINGLTRCSAPGFATPVEPQFPLPLVDASLPSYWERWEGMSIRFAEPLVVIDQFATGRFGQVELAAGRRLWQATQHTAPGPDAVASLRDDERYRILLDDGSARVAPDPWPYLEVHSDGALRALRTLRTLRLGDLASQLEGVLGFSFGRFRIQPIAAPRLDAQGTAPPPPSVAGALRIVSWNVENLFNGDGTGGGFPTRGAGSPFEYERQRAKVVATLAALDADIVALVELENDGVAPGSVLRDLAEALRAHAPALDYRPVDPTTRLGNHTIAVGLLYRDATALALGPASVLDERAHSSFDSGRNRPSLAQTFLHLESGELVTVIVNHFKSKGSSCSAVGDPDLGDGQGNCNLTRRHAARALVEWIASDPTSSGGAPALILGDLNAHPLEDPVSELTGAGFVDLLSPPLSPPESPDAYTFVFDGRVGRLDYALASPQLLSRVAGAAVWNINADESPALDYRADNPEGLYVADARRASDHDPVIVGLFSQPVPEPASRALVATALAALCALRRRGATLALHSNTWRSAHGKPRSK